MYRLDYQYTHDIDWFCRINGAPVHLASNGGHLPNCYSIEQLVSLQHRVANLRNNYRCAVNIGYLEDYLRQDEFLNNMGEFSDEEYRLMLPEEFELSDDIKDLPKHIIVYAWSFIEMAKKGFISFDRGQNVNGVDIYHLVARPLLENRNPRVLENLGDLHQYRMCCIPPSHPDYDPGNLPKNIRFHDQSEFEQFTIIS